MHRTNTLLSKLALFTTIGVVATLFSPADATPVITGVSGSVSQNGQVTISGSGFGVKSPAQPYLWAPMDGSAQPSSLGIVTSWATLTQLTYQAGCGPAGGGCLVGAPSNGVSTNAWAGSIMAPSTSDWNAYGREIYVYRKSKRDFSYDSSKNVKVMRMWDAVPGSTTSFQLPDVYFATSNGRMGTEGIPQNGTYDYTMSGATLQRAMGPVNAWYTEEFLLKSNSSSTSADADFRMDVDGGPDLVSFPNTGWEANTLTYKTASGYSNDGRMLILYPIHMVVEGSDGWVPSPAGSEYWVTDVYADNTWSRVMIGDAPVFAQCTDREIQIPFKWADGSISVYANVKAFPSGKPMYLFVVDANDNASAGYPLTADPNPPTLQGVQ